MPQLQSARHEMFARYRAGGSTQIAAYTQAGFSFNRGNAAKLNKKEDILARIKELQEERSAVLTADVKTLQGIEAKTSDDLGLSELWVLKELMVTALLAKDGGEYKAAKECLELIGQRLGMFTKSTKASEKPTRAIPDAAKRLDIGAIEKLARADIAERKKNNEDIGSSDETDDTESAEES